MKQSNLKKTLAKVFALVLLSLVAFNVKAGLDSYKIYLNNKLILEQFVNKPLNIKSLQLDKANATDKLVIFYSHCGVIGKERTIAIKDDEGKILKEWKFANVTGSDESMVIPVKELLVLVKNNSDAHLNIYYAAQQLPKGRMLTSVNIGNHNVTYLKKNKVAAVN